MAVEEIIGRSDDAAVAVRRITAFDDGFQLDLVAWLRRQARGRRRRRFHREILLSAHGPFDVRDDDGGVVAELVRFGVQFPDGAEATNLGGAWMPSHDATEPMHGLESRGGSSSDSETEQTFWIWPIPKEGGVDLVCEWPAHNIVESRLTIDGDSLRAAASRSVPVWSDEPPHRRGG